MLLHVVVTLFGLVWINRQTIVPHHIYTVECLYFEFISLLDTGFYLCGFFSSHEFQEFSELYLEHLDGANG